MVPGSKRLLNISSDLWNNASAYGAKDRARAIAVWEMFNTELATANQNRGIPISLEDQDSIREHTAMVSYFKSSTDKQCNFDISGGVSYK